MDQSDNLMTLSGLIKKVINAFKKQRAVRTINVILQGKSNQVPSDNYATWREEKERRIMQPVFESLCSCAPKLYPVRMQLPPAGTPIKQIAGIFNIMSSSSSVCIHLIATAPFCNFHYAKT